MPKKERQLVETPSGNLIAQQRFEYRVSILPPPDELERYEAMHLGTTKVILDSYIGQINHRMELEKIVVTEDNKRANIGQIISGILAFLSIISGSILSFLGKDAIGLSLIIGSVGTLLTAFYGGAILRKFEREKKDRR
jgi:uncharacterized membrane protein